MRPHPVQAITATRHMMEIIRILISFFKAISNPGPSPQEQKEKLRKELRQAYRDGKISGRQRAAMERKIFLAVTDEDCEAVSLSCHFCFTQHQANILLARGIRPQNETATQSCVPLGGLNRWHNSLS